MTYLVAGWDIGYDSLSLFTISSYWELWKLPLLFVRSKSVASLSLIWIVLMLSNGMVMMR